MGDIDDQLAELEADGDGDAAFELGYHYVHDHGDLATAERFYRVAIGAGELHACNNLARILGEQGRDDEAITLYRRGADGGDARAAVNLARFFSERDRDADAFAAVTPAAEDGDPEAQEYLGRMHFSREEWEPSERWFRAAAEHDNPAAVRCVGVLRSIAGDEAEAERWLRRAIDLGDAPAAHELAKRIRDRDLPEAERLSRIAVDADPDDGYFQHGLGQTLEQQGRTAEAAEAYERAVRAGNANSAMVLGWMLQERDGDEAAEPWFRHAMDAGIEIGFTAVALIEWDRENVAEAERLFRHVADEEPLARFNLGLLRGQAGATDEADRLIAEAAERGCEQAGDWLREHGA